MAHEKTEKAEDKAEDKIEYNYATGRYEGPRTEEKPAEEKTPAHPAHTEAGHKPTHK
jgi:hypothetical protein